MKKIIFQLVTTTLLFTATAAIISMQQPGTPRGKRHVASTPAYWSAQFTQAINNQEYMDAVDILQHLPHHPVAMDCVALLRRNMTPNNIFYTKANFEKAFLAPINADHLMVFATGIIKNGQKKTRSSEANAYFKAAEQRLKIE